jgi:hypothetical protein
VNRNGSVIVTNEFASVEIRIGRHSNGPAAWVTDRKSGITRKVDPLVLEGLVWASEEVLASLADPGARK